MNNVWDLKEKHIPKEKNWQPQVQEEPVFRTLHQSKPVTRSGMQSKDNPLCNTQQYYPETKTASRGGAS